MDIKSFKSGHVEPGAVTHPPVGRHVFTIKSVFFTNDRIKTLREPTLKETVPPWSDVTEQAACVFWTPEGVITRRMNGDAWLRYEQLTQEQKDSGLYTSMSSKLGNEGYAVLVADKTRVPDPVREKSCENIINQLFAAAGLPLGSGWEDLVGRKVSAEIYEREWPVGSGTVRKDIKNFRPVGDEAPVDLTEKVELQADKF